MHIPLWIEAAGASVLVGGVLALVVFFAIYRVSK